MTRSFEDFEVGDSWELGQLSFDREGIIDFASEYDPLPFHTDLEAAKDTRYNGLIASGWQIALRSMRLTANEILVGSACEAGRGVDSLRIFSPVRPGDTLLVNAQVVNKTRESRPAYGLVELKVTATGEKGQEVFSMVLLPMIRRETPRN